MVGLTVDVLDNRELPVPVRVPVELSVASGVPVEVLEDVVVRVDVLLAVDVRDEVDDFVDVVDAVDVKLSRLDRVEDKLGRNDTEAAPDRVLVRVDVPDLVGRAAAPHKSRAREPVPISSLYKVE